MKKLLALVLVLTMALTLAACGGGNPTVSQDTTVSDTKAETGAPAMETVAVGNKITTEFVEISVKEAGITNSLRTSIKNGSITYTFGPEDSAETDYAYIKGTIMNKSTSSINENILATAKVGEYTLKDDDVTIYTADGDTVWELAPLIEYNFMLSVEIPNALVEGMESCDFNFGFNKDMASAFDEFDELEYKYTLKITPEAEAAEPAPSTAE